VVQILTMRVKLLKIWKKFDDKTRKLLYKSAIQLAIIGFGGRNYGFIRDENDHLINLIDLFTDLKIKHSNEKDQKYVDGELSVRRLTRLFRFQIHHFIIKNNQPSFLWQKYSNKIDLKYMPICFPGGEHVLKTKEEAIFLLDTYKNLDILQKTKFCVRLRRVFIARGILSPSFFLENKYE